MFKAALHFLGTRLARPIYGGAGCILALHRVVPESERSRLSVNRALEIRPSDLDAIIQLLRRRGFTFVAMDEVLNRLSAPRRGRFAAVTLDDGYRDNMQHALPIFEGHDVPFTVFATRGFSEHRDSVWWYSLEEALLREGFFTLRDGGREETFSLPDDPARERLFNVLAHRLRACRFDEREELINSIFRPLGIDPLRATRELIFGQDELRDLARHPLATLGAHTVHHLTSNLLDEATLRAEFADGKAWLEDLCGKEVRHLAYPFGGRNAVGPREFEIAQKCGFHTAVTTRFATLFPTHAKMPWALPRLEISGNYKAERFAERAVSGLLPALRNRGRRVVTD
jgi:peptidoglycan/xylan/chitin deacetylase (PgdA/CDA1 family)